MPAKKMWVVSYFWMCVVSYFRTRQPKTKRHIL